MLKVEDLQKSKLVEIGWRFGQTYGGGYLAAQKVMSVLANRVRAGWGPWLDVLSQYPEYMAENEVPPLVYPGVWDGAFVKLLHVVEGVFDGSAQDSSNGGMYWADLNKVERPWFSERIIQAKKDDGTPKHTMCNNMNSLTFWR